MFYLVGISVGCMLTIIAMTTPAWRQFNSDGVANYKQIPQSFGIVSGTCNGSCIDYYSVRGFSLCFTVISKVSSKILSFSQNQPGWKKGVLACMILAVLSCLAGFVWSFLACFACCCTSFLVIPLPICAGLACLLDIIGVTV